MSDTQQNAGSASAPKEWKGDGIVLGVKEGKTPELRYVMISWAEGKYKKQFGAKTENIGEAINQLAEGVKVKFRAVENTEIEIQGKNGAFHPVDLVWVEIDGAEFGGDTPPPRPQGQTPSQQAEEQAQRPSANGHNPSPVTMRDKELALQNVVKAVGAALSGGSAQYVIDPSDETPYIDQFSAAFVKATMRIYAETHGKLFEKAEKQAEEMSLL